MDREFWLDRWSNNQIGFHRDEVNPFLLRHHAVLGAGSRVLVPLCGKSLDLGWLAAQGHEVVGIELSSLAVGTFFAEHRLAPVVDRHVAFSRYRAGGIEILCGDYFDIDAKDVGAVTAWYDRAALIALPEAMRQRYVDHTAKLVQPGARGLLVTLDYEPSIAAGPPFSVSDAEVQKLYASQFTVKRIERNEVLSHEPRFLDRGITSMHEQACALSRHGIRTTS
jgi:thiopurine S-methyltransferase